MIGETFSETQNFIEYKIPKLLELKNINTEYNNSSKISNNTDTPIVAV